MHALVACDGYACCRSVLLHSLTRTFVWFGWRRCWCSCW
jgi:hypothetical protein